MPHRLVTSAKRISRNIFHNISSRKFGKRVVRKFSDKTGLIYFGAVDWQKDDFIPIKGFSVSAKHIDNHYCVGTFEGYDLKLVNRCDALVKNDGSFFYNNFLIVSINLKTEVDIPHIFLDSNNHNEVMFDLLFMTSKNLKNIELGVFENYSHEFTTRYTMYANPMDNIMVQKLFNANLTQVLASHLWPLSVEIQDNILYIYASADKASIHTLETMTTVGMWIAKNIDSLAESI